MKAPRVDLSLRDIADGCRSAGLDLLEGIAHGWTKADLVKWLVGPYRRLTRLHLSPDELAWADVIETRTGNARASEPPPSDREPSISERAVQTVLVRARREVLHELGKFAFGSDPMGFVFRARARGSVIRCIDPRGRTGFVPIAERSGSMRLAERALSLFATDFLLRPNAYEDHCTVCVRCGVVVFDPRARTTLECGMHATPVAPPVVTTAAPPSYRGITVPPRHREESGIELKGEGKRDTWREFPAVEVPRPPKLPRVG